MVNSPHNWPVTRKMFPFDDVIMEYVNPCRVFRKLSDIFPFSIISQIWVSAGNWNPSSSKTRICIPTRHDDVIKWKHFRVTGQLCVEFTGHPWITAQMPVTHILDVYFDLRPNKWLSKQWLGRWFETPPHPLWRPCKSQYHGRWWPNLLRRHVISTHDISPKRSNG